MNLHRNSAALTGRALAVGLAVAVVSSAAFAAEKATPIDGVWQVTNVTVTGANPLTITSPQPNLYIYSHGHYAWVTDNGRTPRTSVTFKDPANPTDAEKLAKYAEWSPVAAQAGSYTVKGSTLIREPTAAKNVAAIGPTGKSEAEFKLTGDTLVLVSQAPAGQPARETRLTLTRVK